MKERIFKGTFDIVKIKKSPRKCGYVASYYNWLNKYCGCEHFTNLDNFIHYRLNGYVEVNA